MIVYRFLPTLCGVHPLLHYIDVLQLSAIAVIVQPIADDEVVGNPEGAIVNVELRLQIAGLCQQGANAEVGGAHGLKLLCQGLHRQTRINDVFHNDDAAAFDFLCQAEHLRQASRTLHAIVAADADKGNMAGRRDTAQQIGSEDERSVENYEEERLAPLHFHGDLLSQLLHAEGYLLRTDEGLEIAVFD